MASFIMKKLITASNLVTRSIIQFRSALGTTRRGYDYERCLKDLNYHGGLNKLADDSHYIFERIPYTARVFATSAGLERLSMGSFINLAKDLKIHICTPGDEKWKETDEGLCTFIDTGVTKLEERVLSVVTDMERNFLSIEVKGKDKCFFSRVYLPVADNIPSGFNDIKGTKDGGLLITLTENVASDNIIRSVFPSCPYVETNNQRGSSFSSINTDLNDGISSHELLEIIMKKYLDKLVPHTLYTYETNEGLEHLNNGDFDTRNIKRSIHVPGNETMAQTNEGLCIYLDTGMGNWDDYEDVNMTTELKHVRVGNSSYSNVLFIEAYAKNKQIKRTCSSSIYLYQDDVYKEFNTKIKNGVLIITFPNVKED